MYSKRFLHSTALHFTVFIFVPVNEKHVRVLVREWTAHYNQGRPHMSLGPGIPDPPASILVALRALRHAIPNGFQVKKRSILSDLHHEYRLERIAA